MSATVGWVVFSAIILAMLALDLGVFHRKPHEVRSREAAASGAPSGWRWPGLQRRRLRLSGAERGSSSCTGYLIEKSLSVDNIFVFVLLFGYFARAGPLPAPGAVLGHPRRAGDARGHDPGRRRAAQAVPLDHLRLRRLPDRSPACRMALRARRPRSTPRRNPVVRLPPAARARSRPTTAAQRSSCARAPVGAMATPLLVVLVVVEITDLVFAVDSIPAIFAVTTRPVHRLHLQRLRHPGPALAVLPAGRRDRTGSTT